VIATRPFYVAGVLFTTAGAALRLAPVGAPEPTDSAPIAAAATVVPRQQPSVGADRFAAIVASNAFSAGRTAPPTRLIPEGLRRDTQPAARPARKPRQIPARLFGITRGPGGAVALIDADPAIPGAEVYRVGDAVRDGRLTAIGDSTVVLTRPSGRLVLRLPDAGERR
jgi:hypothetical protein